MTFASQTAPAFALQVSNAADLSPERRLALSAATSVANKIYVEKCFELGILDGARNAQLRKAENYGQNERTRCLRRARTGIDRKRPNNEGPERNSRNRRRHSQRNLCRGDPQAQETKAAAEGVAKLHAPRLDGADVAAAANQAAAKAWDKHERTFLTALPKKKSHAIS